jgi:hypothetical protein
MHYFSNLRPTRMAERRERHKKYNTALSIVNQTLGLRLRFLISLYDGEEIDVATEPLDFGRTLLVC